MKWVFLLAIIMGTPALAGLLRSKPRYLVQTCSLIGLLMYAAVVNLWVAPIPWPGWPGPVQGLEISALDGISVAVIAATQHVRISSTIRMAFAIICVAALISTFAGMQVEPAVFYDFQLFRAVLLFLAIARVCAMVPQAPIALIAGLGTGLFYEAILSTNQYLHGADRPGGNLGHSNYLGFSEHFVVFPALALMLGTRRTLWPALVVLCGLVIAVTGGSRATLAIFAIGLVLTLVLSVQRGSTSRKWAFVGTAALLMIVATPVMIWAANRRSEAAKISSDEERGAMKLAARMIIADHPLGIGANQYVVVANTGGYSQRAGVPWNVGSRSAPVHNTYYLVTAELGFLGLVGFVALLGSLVVYGFRLLRVRSDDPVAELVPGLLAALIVVCIHLAYEWVFMHFMLHYMFAICTGMLAGIGARMRGSAKVAQPVRPRLAVASPAG